MIKKMTFVAVAALTAFTSFSAKGNGLSPDEQEWADQYRIVKAVADHLNMPVKIRLLRGTPVDITPAALDYNTTTGVCTLVISPNANQTAQKLLDSVSGVKRSDRILAVLAHEYGHCVAYKTGFTKVGTPIQAKDEAYSDIFSLAFMAIARPNSYDTVVKMWAGIRTDPEVADARYSSTWIKYATEIWVAQSSPDVTAAEYAVK